MDREKIRALRTALQEAVKGVEQEHKVTVRFGSASYLDNNCRFRVDVMEHDASGAPINREAALLSKGAARYGLPADVAGKEVSIGGRKFKLVGLNPKAHRFPVLGQCVRSGKTYKLPLQDVQLALGVTPDADDFRGEALGY